MFKDAQKELKRLEELLEEEEEELSEEEPEEEFDEAFFGEYEDEPKNDDDEFDEEEWEQIHATLVFRSGAEKFRQQLAAQQAGSRAYNSDRTDLDPEDLEEELSGGNSLTGLVVLTVLLTLGIVGTVSWFLLRYMR